MASAAAVGADSMESPLDETTLDGTITGNIQPRDPSSEEDDADANANDDDNLDSDDADEGANDDLFGDEDDEPRQKKPRQLDDEELDSGDDLGRDDRQPEDEDEEPAFQQRAFAVAELDLVRSAMPKPSDGEMYLLKIPNFLEIDPKGFALSTFKPPTTDHHSKKNPSASFSAYGTAMTTIRWRRSPSDPSQLQSNARILRWSDGSLTLQLASDPLTQYELPANALAPPQINPPKPTPTSQRDMRNKSRRNQYNASKDSYTYLATPHPEHAVMRFTNKVTIGLQVLHNAASGNAANGAVDEALERLQDRMLEAQRAKEEAAEGGMLVSHEETFEDPENAKRRAEQAEKEKLRAQRKLETQVNRERDRVNRALGRSGLSTSRGGLTIGGLEDDDMGGVGRYAGGRPSKPKKKRMLRDEYSDEDDYAGRRTTKEDEYDMDLDFMAKSDEDEDAEGEDDGDESDDIDQRIEAQERIRERERQKDRASPKRPAPIRDADDADQEAAPKAAASKRRRVVDDDEDD